jgi:hypothetical protein
MGGIRITISSICSILLILIVSYIKDSHADGNSVVWECNTPNCILCVNGNCTACAGNNWIDNTVNPPVCVPVCSSVVNCAVCPTVSGAARCNQCFAPLYGLNTTADPPTCILCSSISGCSQCTTTSVCQICADTSTTGPDLKTGLATCSACGGNCKYCGDAGSGLCDVCEEGSQTPVSSQCVCGPNCLSCTNNGYTLCDEGECIAGYGLSATTSNCQPCAKYCQKCNTPAAGAGKCDVGGCITGYTTNSQGLCVVPPDCDVSCATCVNGVCGCAPDFALTPTQQCSLVKTN